MRDRRQDDNIKMYLQEAGCDDVDWVHLTQQADSIGGEFEQLGNYQLLNKDSTAWSQLL